MSEFELVEVPFDPNDFESTLEDEFLIAKLTKEIEAVTDIEQIKLGALKLLHLAVLRQGMIRGLVRRLANLEADVIRTRYPG
jgi:hypothetical protein